VTKLHTWVAEGHWLQYQPVLEEQRVSSNELRDWTRTKLVGLYEQQRDWIWKEKQHEEEPFLEE
jgi:hypothetical protein